MARHRAETPTTTQSAHPWRATARTLFALIVGVAAMAPAIYTAVTGDDPAAASGWAATALAISGAVTRVMALEAVEAFLQAYVPWLAARPRDTGEE